MANDGPARHRPWYIDFRGDPLLLSKLAFTKNVIFVNRAESEPEVYRELRHFTKALNADIENFNMKNWWGHQKRCFEKLRAEFEFGPLALRPSRRSVRQKPCNIALTLRRNDIFSIEAPEQKTMNQQKYLGWVGHDQTLSQSIKLLQSWVALVRPPHCV